MPTPRKRPSRARTAALVALVLAFAACSPAKDAQARAAVSADILDLVNAVSPLDPNLARSLQGDYYARRNDVLERLRVASPAHGIAALTAYEERDPRDVEIRCGLLDVAAHCAPEETRPTLVALLANADDDLKVRTTAVELLGATSPETAVEEIEPILRGELTGRTYPSDEHLLRAWNEAMVTLQRDRIPMLCDVATDLPRHMDVRHLATKLLGEIESVQGRQALEQLMVESAGNHMLRRFAAQSLRTSIPKDEFCALLDRVIANEADAPFAIFLDNMRLSDCQ